MCHDGKSGVLPVNIFSPFYNINIICLHLNVCHIYIVPLFTVCAQYGLNRMCDYMYGNNSQGILFFSHKGNATNNKLLYWRENLSVMT